MSFIQEAESAPSREISGTCGKSTLSMSSHSTGHEELSLGSNPREILLRAGSENEPIQLHSTPVLTRRWNTNQERLGLVKLWTLLNSSVNEDLSTTFWKRRTESRK